MTMPLTLLFVSVLAAALELLVHWAPALLARLLDRESLRVDVERARADLVESSKRVDTLSTSLKAVRQELGRAREAVVDLDRELEKRGVVPPILLFSITKMEKDQGVRLFRAPLAKTLKPEAESHQSQIWRRSCFVEVTALSRAQAVIEASLQFPAEGGYKVGAFREQDEAAA